MTDTEARQAQGDGTTGRPVTLEFDGPVGWITLNRPEQLNAFSQSLMDALNDAIDEVQANRQCRVVVVSGAGRAFSAGGDLNQFDALLKSGSHQRIVEFVAYAAGTLSRLESLAKPVIAAVNGVAVAGGLELILCCDLVVAAAGVKMGDGHLRYGVLPGGGGAARLMRKLPPNLAKSLLLSGDLVTAEQLHQWGLVNDIVAGDELRPFCQQLAARLASLSPLALGHVKRVANAAASQPFSDGLALELDAFSSYVRSRDFGEGITAFQTRRTPEFTGE